MARPPVASNREEGVVSDTPKSLPIIESCDGCGACCQVVSRPPFYRVFDEEGEDTWERLKWERPDLMAGFLADDRDRRANGGPYYGTPCIWFDAGTGRCRHYEYRPAAPPGLEGGGP